MGSCPRQAPLRLSLSYGLAPQVFSKRENISLVYM